MTFLRESEKRRNKLENKLFEHTIYGGWSVQRPGHGTIGRYSPDMTRVMADGRTVELKLRLDRAVYQLFRASSVEHRQAMDDSLLCPSFAGAYNAAAKGVWEFDLKAPNTDRVC